MAQIFGIVQHKIKLRPNEVEAFVNAASKCDFDVDIAYNSYVVDAKSILGVLGLDLSRTLTVTCHGYDSDFEACLSKFSIAC